MIEINLIPDVKIQLLRARRVRTNVISIAIVVAIASVGLVVLLALYTFGALTIADVSASNAIQSEDKKLQSVTDLSKTLTIQNQMAQLAAMHGDKNITSRMFDILTTIIPPGDNVIAVSQLSLDTDNNLITIEGSAVNGYEALEVFKKTIAQTNFEYIQDGKTQTPLKIADVITDGDRRYSEDASGQRVLRFTLSFTYPDQLFSPQATQGRIVAPTKQNATDSALGVPKSLFVNRDTSGGAQ